MSPRMSWVSALAYVFPLAACSAPAAAPGASDGGRQAAGGAPNAGAPTGGAGNGLAGTSGGTSAGGSSFGGATIGGATTGGSAPTSNGGAPSAGTAGASAGVGTGGGAGLASGGASTVAGAGGVGSGGAATGGASATGGSAGGNGQAGATHTRDHCVEGFDPDPSDKAMLDGPAEFTKSGQIDLTVQPAVLTWMQNHKWQAAHFEWHSIRRCKLGSSQSRVNICSRTDMIPTDQECQTSGDGYQFLVMHRHMMQSLRQLFPTHTEQFEGFPKFPQSANDVPAQWRASWSAFSAQDLANAKIADEIDKPENLSKFANEGAFGQWLQCLAPTHSGLHGALHFKWVRTQNSEHGLGNQHTNIDNYMFWKLHGWIDKVWEKYRVAKGQQPGEQKLKDELVAQCREMDALARIIDPSLPPDPGSTTLPPESGVFVKTVRPIFESDVNKCSGCHGPTGAEAGLSLGGNISGANIVSALVNKPSTRGGQFRLVVPGDPDKSWLYLKVAGQAAAAGCTASGSVSCNTQVMPPNSSGQTTVSAAELMALRQWIQDGAPAPTSP